MTLALISVWSIITIVALGIIYSAFLKGNSRQNAQSLGFRDYQSLQYERLRLIENLHDLDSDFGLSKIKAEDYQELKADLLIQLDAIYKKIDQWEATDPLYQKILRQIDTRKKSA